MEKKIILIGDESREEVVEAMKVVSPILLNQEFSNKRVKYSVESVFIIDRIIQKDISEIEADLLVVFGGDGTLLGVARALRGNQIPVLGVNFGKFGFLAEFEYKEFKSNIVNIVEGKYKLCERLLLETIVYRKGLEVFSNIALNDIVISRSHFSRIIKLAVRINKLYCTNYHVDGIIISTPSGSTAHSLGAGGPLISPSLDVTTITPICPHTMTMRPLVISADDLLQIDLVGKSDIVAMTIDGQEMFELELDDLIVVRKAQKPINLVVSGLRTFYDRLHQKFNWAGHSNVKG